MRSKKQFFGWLIAALMAVSCWQLVSFLLDHQALTELMHNAGRWRVVVFIGAHTIAAAVGVPGTVLAVLGGALFGLIWGTLWSILGATAGAVVAFWLARYLLHDWFKRRFSQHPRFQGLFHRLDHTMQHQSLSCVLAIRFAPVSPFNAVNFLFGLTNIAITPYALGTLIGIIPGTMAYTWLGVTGVNALRGGNWLPVILCLSLLMGLSLVPIFVQKYRQS
ncbi:TVP38/TMEM64 family protein [Leptothoe sp. PORK10 BA2]|uniref:TVP38/TMEM64 family protein n=1 Tax=Leptothoe sp. PORK10 BA2 TaxID=3110254 RepID=UPI002B1F892B|nr:TVP38/TMEM64 family protein [Leptothoe sp. PORK10 BA2]MEA5466235.1 TVP38/TMEM64 family protein [Leptothoe sp. PORK10 BA2]